MDRWSDGPTNSVKTVYPPTNTNYCVIKCKNEKSACILSFSDSVLILNMFLTHLLCTVLVCQIILVFSCNYLLHFLDTVLFIYTV